MRLSVYFVSAMQAKMYKLLILKQDVSILHNAAPSVCCKIRHHP